MDKNIEILINDNSIAMRQMLKKFLVNYEYNNIYETDDCSMAINKLKNEEFHLLISEWNFIEGNCEELLKQIRTEDKLKELKIMIMFSGEISDEQKEIMKNTNVNAYIQKPFARENFRIKLNEILGNK